MKNVNVFIVGLLFYLLLFFSRLHRFFSSHISAQHATMTRSVRTRSSLKLFFFPPFLYVPCSHCYTFPSSMCVRRRHPQSCIFVNWKGSGSGGCRGEGGDSSRLLGWLTFQPQTQREMAGENEATCVCVSVCEWICVCACMCFYGWVCRLSDFSN